MPVPDSTVKVPPVLSAEAREFLVQCLKVESDGEGPPCLSAETVPLGAELLAAGQIALSDYKGAIEVRVLKGEKT